MSVIIGSTALGIFVKLAILLTVLNGFDGFLCAVDVVVS